MIETLKVTSDNDFLVLPDPTEEGEVENFTAELERIANRFGYRKVDYDAVWEDDETLEIYYKWTNGHQEKETTTIYKKPLTAAMNNENRLAVSALRLDFSKK